eukprot:scaffold70532_cov80-Phaeocystis_antarctica.AAC.2
MERHRAAQRARTGRAALGVALSEHFAARLLHRHQHRLPSRNVEGEGFGLVEGRAPVGVKLKVRAEPALATLLRAG